MNVAALVHAGFVLLGIVCVGLIVSQINSCRPVPVAHDNLNHWLLPFSPEGNHILNMILFYKSEDKLLFSKNVSFAFFLEGSRT